MIKTDFSKCKNEFRVLRPIVRHCVRDAYGQVIGLEPFDERWRIEKFENGVLHLYGIHSNFNLPLNPNDILDDKLSNPGGADFLYIKSQVVMDGARIFLEPLPRQAPSANPALPIPRYWIRRRRPIRLPQAK